MVLVWVLGKVPGLDTSAIATFTDRGTGSAGAGAAGTVYDLYLSAERWLDYPPPQYAIEALLLLEVGPWVFNIMGLFVVLSAVLPLLMVLVRRGLWWLLLALSWAAYVVGTVTGAQLLPSQFEDVFPLLIWQLPFVHGLVLGHYRRQVLRALTRRTGAIVVGVLVVGYAAALGWLWLSHTHGVPGPFPAGTWDLLAERGYTRVVLQPGRLVDLPFFLAVSYVVLTFCWVPISRAISWLWTPLGRSSLYVFIVHVFFVLAVANVPGLDRESVWQGTLVHTVVILAIWGMVKRRVLFGVIPR